MWRALLALAMLAGCAARARLAEPPVDGAAGADIDTLGELSRGDRPSAITDTTPIAGARFGVGDGSAQARALVILEARDVVATESAVLRRTFGPVSYRAQSRYASGGRTYDVVTIERADGHTSEIWFDVTAVAPR